MGGGTGLGNIPEKINVPLSDSQSQFFLLTNQSLRRAVNSELNEIMLSSNHFRFIRSSILIVFLSSAGGQTLDPPDPTTHHCSGCLFAPILQSAGPRSTKPTPGRCNIFISNFTKKCYWLSITNLTLFTKTNNKRVKKKRCAVQTFICGGGLNMFS